MKTFEAMAQAMLDNDKDQGHVGANQQWGKYESNARAALELLKRRGVISKATLDSILKGDA